MKCYGSHPPLDPDLAILRMIILQDWEIGNFFDSLAHIGKTDLIFVKILLGLWTFLWTRKFLSNCGSHPDPTRDPNRIHRNRTAWTRKL